MRAALEAELPGLRPAVIRSRFHLTRGRTVAEIVDTLDRHRDGAARRASMLKAPDDREVVAAVERLVAPASRSSRS